MIEQNDLWNRIDATAKRMGVPYFTRRKWRQRGTVPHKWRLALIQQSGGQIVANDFISRDNEAA